MAQPSPPAPPPNPPRSPSLVVATVLSLAALVLLATYLTSSHYRHALHSPNRRMLPTLQCTLNSTTYFPSELERDWIVNAQFWGGPHVDSDAFAAHLTPMLPSINTWLAKIHELMTDPTSVNISKAELRLFSHFRYTYHCGGYVRHHRSIIEPLVGSLRHPLFGIPGTGDNHLLDKSYLLLPSVYIDAVTYPSWGRVFVFDLGASTYDEGGGGPSQKWFVETLLKRGFEIDRYFGWEVLPVNDAVLLSKLPGWLFPRYNYYNIPANTSIDNPNNPLNVIKTVARRDDYVLLKIDIDTAAVEMAFIQQLLDDPALCELVDEFFFEHHVNFQPLKYAWVGTMARTQQLRDSYKIFSTLRHRGVRAHGWV